MDDGLVDGRYRVVAQLGEGSMGTVYRAHDVTLDRSVALKMIRPVHASDDRLVQRFRREARALAQIRHVNVVQIYAFGEHARSYFFAMEHVVGQSLERLMMEHERSRIPMSCERVLEIARAVAEGLGAVHAANLVHRDVKPSNIVIEEESGRPVLVDFGLAKSTRTVKSSGTSGTPFYMAPEQISSRGASSVTSRSDIYSFACMLFELLAGVSPFESDDIQEVLLAHLGGPRPILSDHRPELAKLDPIFQRALAIVPEQRHERAVELVDEIEDALSGIVFATTVAPPPDDALVVRVVLHASEEPLVRQLSRLVTRALWAEGLVVATQYVREADAIAASLLRWPAQIVVLESSAAAAPAVVGALRAARRGGDCEIVVLSNDWPDGAAALDALGACHLPKPVNRQLLEATLVRLARPLVEARRA